MRESEVEAKMYWQWHLLRFISLIYFCAPTRLLPSDDSIIHCAGQSNDAFEEYSQYLHPDTRPAVQMVYMGLSTSTNDIQNYFKDLESQIETYSSQQWVGIQLGLDFSGLSTQIAAGQYDVQLETMISSMKSMNRPFWIRLGYEFNGEWNNYAPKSDFIASFQRITSMLRNDSWANEYVANIWDFSADAQDLDYMSWYPGDEYVDWWGVNIFSDSSKPTSQYVTNFVEDACEKGFPIIFGESTPRYTGVLNGTQSWNEWFQPYFYDLILKNNSCVHQFCYINWNWTATTRWPNWGDAQIQDNEVVEQNYQSALYQGNYFHATNKTTVLKKLGF